MADIEGEPQPGHDLAREKLHLPEIARTYLELESLVRLPGATAVGTEVERPLAIEPYDGFRDNHGSHISLEQQSRPLAEPGWGMGV